MTTIIYSFTGTGNTLAAARQLADALGDTTIIPITRVTGNGPLPHDVESADAIGIAFPVYYMDMPRIVQEFVSSLRFNGSPYIFGIASCGGNAGAALHNLDTLLKEKGTRLSLGVAITMPENFIGPISLMEPEEKVEGILTSARDRIPEIAAAIRERRESLPEGSNSLPFRIGGSFFRLLTTSIYPTHKKLHATERCNGCGICGRICPTRNITVSDSAVTWESDCTWCYACIHWCPQEAVEIGGRTKGKRRYHHPDVTVKDMVEQRGG
ncbi:ferredoxin/flavodoxin [Methanocalculus alkaliphilus]|uniref:EFR1 family ferrodoxin n=1 Tax=Methanocalculus alkaliphilus TaxID=768730 RepID=UPI00209E39E7|nr:EFR1 family ferrodoxin [Methanocalculus alkaliphilus]MCP1715318.1 ferredoxin/flavodoxin [Methanocalculus alkaliphilus]